MLLRTDDVKSIFILILLAACGLMPAACDVEVPEGDSAVEVCNYDDEEYAVKLHNADTGIVIDEFTLEEVWELDDSCDEFKDLFAGNYYITIYEDEDTEATDKSEDFYLDGEEDISFIIDSTGDIEED